MSELKIRVRGYHLDVFLHVNNARYLEFLEEGRWAFFEHDTELMRCLQNQVTFAVVNININFRSGAVLHDVLNIKTALTKIGHKSAVIEQVIYLDGSEKVIADAQVTFVFVDQNTNKVMPIKHELREYLEKKWVKT